MAQSCLRFESQLLPLPRPPSHVGRPFLLGDDALEPGALGGAKELHDVAVHRSRVRQRRPATLEQLLQKLAARLDRLSPQVAPVEPQEVEDRVSDASVLFAAAQPLLERAERRPARLVDDARLPVHYALACGELRDRVRDRTETVGPVVLVARVEPNLGAGLAGEQAITVVFHLEEPRRGVGDRLHGDGERRLPDCVEQAARALALLRSADALRPARGDAPADDRLRPLGDDVVGRVGVRVFGLEEEPLRLSTAARAVVSAAPTRANDVPVTDQLFAEESDVEVALLEHRVLLAARDRVVRAAVPDEHVAGAVLLVGDAPFELVVGHRVVLGLNRQTARGRVVARALRHRPAHHRPVDFEPEVVVQAPRVVFLHDEHGADLGHRRGTGHGRRFLFPTRLGLQRFVGRRLRRHAEAALRTIRLQSIAALPCSARLARVFFRRRSLSNASFLVR